MIRFSSEPTPAYKAYLSLRNSMGPAFSGPVGEARMYAHAMALGVAQCELDSAAGQFRADRVTTLLPAVEAEYGIVPAIDANDQTRRAALAAAQQLRNGARNDAMIDGLTGILGSAFVRYLINNIQTSVPTNPLTTGTYKPLGSPMTVIRITSGYIMPSASAQACTYEYICGDNEPLKLGDTLEVDPGINGIAEPITLQSADASSFTAIFSKPHDAGTIATTAPFPNWASWKRHVLIVVTPATITNVALMKRVGNFMTKWSRIVTTWDVVADNGDGATSGPFYPNSGLPGHTPISQVSY